MNKGDNVMDPYWLCALCGLRQGHYSTCPAYAEFAKGMDGGVRIVDTLKGST